MSSLVIIKNLIGALLISLIFWPHSQTVGGDFTPQPSYKPLKVLKQPPIKTESTLDSLFVAPLPEQDTNSVTSLPPIMNAIKNCESGGDYTAQNPASTASGAYQFLDTTWAGYGGYARALDAPPAVQDAKALLEYNANGTSPWLASSACWD